MDNGESNHTDQNSLGECFYHEQIPVLFDLPDNLLVVNGLNLENYTVNDLWDEPLFDGNNDVRDETNRENGYPSGSYPLLEPVFGNNNVMGETTRENENLPEQEMLYDFGVLKQVDYPVPPEPFICSFCQVLREIIHTNGFNFFKMEIHGGVGLISHVILESRYGGTNNGPAQYQLYDFSKKSLEAVKKLLVQYCDKRKNAGYTMLQDALGTFYEALIAGVNRWEDDIFYDENWENTFGTSIPGHSSHENDIIQPQPPPPSSSCENVDTQSQYPSGSSLHPNVDTQPQYPLRVSSRAANVKTRPQYPTRSSSHTNHNTKPQSGNQATPETGSRPRRRSALSLQRERVANLTLRDFKRYGDYTASEAAKKMGVCLTVLKKICRNYDLKRWPYRKITRIKKKISNNERLLKSCHGEKKRDVESTLTSLWRELTVQYNVFNNPRNVGTII